MHRAIFRHEQRLQLPSQWIVVFLDVAGIFVPFILHYRSFRCIELVLVERHEKAISSLQLIELLSCCFENGV